MHISNVAVAQLRPAEFTFIEHNAPLIKGKYGENPRRSLHKLDSLPVFKRLVTNGNEARVAVGIVCLRLGCGDIRGSI